jgi:hypothetical protein
VAFFAFRQLFWARALTHGMRRLTKNMGARPSLMTTSPSRAAFYGLPSAVHEQPDAENTLPDTDNRLLDAAPRASSGAMNTEHGSHRRSNAWTQVHSYFALMGGFVFLSDVAQPTKLGPEQKRLTLTPSAIRTIARDASMLLPDISAEEIIDKSKASPFTKFLVCTQATWYVAQTVSRLATGIPISLLEMNTVVHAFCCLLVYTAWWYKSLDVEYPHVINITNEFARKVSAWILVNGRLHIPFVANRDGPDSSHVPQSDFELRLLYEKDSLHFDWTFSEHRETRYGKGPDQHAQHLATLQHLADLREQNQAHGRPEHLDAYGCEAQRIPRQSIDTPECIKIYPGQKIHGFSFQHHPHPQSLDADVYAKITLPFIERLRLADSLRREEGSIWSIVPSKNMLTHGSNIVSLDAPNWNSKSFRHNDQWYIKSQSAQPYYFLLGNSIRQCCVWRSTSAGMERSVSNQNSTTFVEDFMSANISSLWNRTRFSLASLLPGLLVHGTRFRAQNQPQHEGSTHGTQGSHLRITRHHYRDTGPHFYCRKSIPHSGVLHQYRIPTSRCVSRTQLEQVHSALWGRLARLEKVLSTLRTIKPLFYFN